MTTGLILGCDLEQDRVKDIARELGYVDKPNDPAVLLYGEDDQLRLQVHESPRVFVDRFKTIVEFDDMSDTWPNNPRAKHVLAEMADYIPDLEISDYSFPLEQCDFRAAEESPYLAEY